MKHLGLSILLLFIFCLNINAQKPKKIFNYIQDNQLTLAVEEYNKIYSDKDYDNEDKVLFAYAKCLFQIDTNYQKYNPTQAIKEFNGTYIQSDIKESIYKFLGKYTLSPEVINQKIINEIYKEAIKLNSIEVYKNALNYCSYQYLEDINNRLENLMYHHIKLTGNIYQLKEFTIRYPKSIFNNEIQILLESNILKYYKSINNIDSLNQFITQFKSSNFKIEAIDFRDSLVLTLTPKNYESLLKFTTEYPNSKYKKEVDERLPFILYEEVIKENSFESLQRFIERYPNDSLRLEIDKKLMDIYISENSVQKKINLQLDILDFNDGLAKVVFGRNYKYDLEGIVTDYNGKIGIIDTLNKILVPIIYDDIERMSNGLFKVSLNGKFGIVNKNGEVLLPLIYEQITENGILVSDDGINKFGLANVSLNNLIGCINLNTFKVIVPIQYVHCIFYEDVKLFIVSTAPNTSISQKWGCLDFNGKPINAINYCCSLWFREGLSKVCLKNGNGKWGCIDKTGKLVIPFIYDYIGEFSDGYAAFMLDNKNKYGLINRVGKIIIPSIYDRISFRNGVAVAEQNGKWGLIDKTGKKLTPFIYDEICLENGLFKVKQIGKWGLIDKTGKIIVPSIYNSISFRNGVTEAEQNGKWGLIDKTGKKLTPFMYDEICLENGLFKVKQNGKWGLIDKTGKRLTLINYDIISLQNEYDYSSLGLQNDLFIVKQNGKYGLIDKTGKELTSFTYDELICLENGLFKVKQNGKYALIDKTGKELTSFIYDEIIKPWDGELLEVRKDEKKGVIDKSGNQFKQINFDYIIEFSNGFGRIVKDDKIGIINRFGEIVIPIIYDEIFLSSGYAIATRQDKSVFIKIDYKASSYNYFSP